MAPRRPRRCTGTPPLRYTIAMPLVIAVVSGCELVDPGPEAGVASPCNVAASFFVERIVPELLDKHGCWGGEEGNCHDATQAVSVYQLQDTSVGLAPLPTDPITSWSAPWQSNYEATIRQLACTSAKLSPLYAKPAGGDTDSHGGGDLFAAGGPELELIEKWLATGG